MKTLSIPLIPGHFLLLCSPRHIGFIDLSVNALVTVVLPYNKRLRIDFIGPLVLLFLMLKEKGKISKEHVMSKKISGRAAKPDYVENSYHEMLDESWRPLREVKLSYNNIEFARLWVEISLEEAAKSPETLASFRDIKEQLQYFKELIESGIRINQDNQQNILRAELVVQGLLLSDPLKSKYLSKSVPLTGIGYYVFIDEDAIFDLIRAEGPRILANPDVQARLMEWLDDPQVASSKMKKLGGALRSYKQAMPRAKRGRAEFSLINRLGDTGTTRDIYKILTRYMRHIKEFYKRKNGNNKKPAELGEDLEDVVDYVLERERDINKNIEYEPVRRMNEHFVRTILAYIQNDKYVKHEFIALKWQPNGLAKLILAQALRVSVSKIEKAVPRRLEA